MGLLWFVFPVSPSVQPGTWKVIYSVVWFSKPLVCWLIQIHAYAAWVQALKGDFIEALPWAFSSPQSPKHFPTPRNSPFWSLLYFSVPATTSAFKDKWQDDRDEKGMWIFLMLLRPQSGQRKRVSIYYSFMHIMSCYCCSVSAGLPCGWGRTGCNTNKKSGEFSPPSLIVGSPFIFYWSETQDLFWTFFWLYLVHNSRFWTVFELWLEKPKWEGK